MSSSCLNLAASAELSSEVLDELDESAEAAEDAEDAAVVVVLGVVFSLEIVDDDEAVS